MYIYSCQYVFLFYLCRCPSCFPGAAGIGYSSRFPAPRVLALKICSQYPIFVQKLPETGTRCHFRLLIPSIYEFSGYQMAKSSANTRRSRFKNFASPRPKLLQNRFEIHIKVKIIRRCCNTQQRPDRMKARTTEQAPCSSHALLLLFLIISTSATTTMSTK